MREERIGPHRLILGDCRALLPELGAYDAIITDPPYGIGYKKGSGGRITTPGRKCGYRNLDAVKGDDGPFDPTPFLGARDVILWGANHFASRLPHGRWLAWDKLAGRAPWDSFSDVEFAWRKGRGKDVIFSHLWKGVIRQSENSGERRQHPTQKPVALMAWCIQQIPDDALIILDPFMGSGTTGVACAKLGRVFVGIECVEKYFDLACRRVEEATKQTELALTGA